MKIAGPIVFTCALALSGCASIVNGTNQTISLQTVEADATVPGALCVLANDKGTWSVRTPGLVSIHRAYGDLTIECDRAGYGPGLLSAKSSTKGAAYGNILFGGVIGAGIDIANGAAYDYPAFITIVMGPRTSDTLFPQSAPAQQPPLSALDPIAQPGPTISATRSLPAADIRQ